MLAAADDLVYSKARDRILMASGHVTLLYSAYDAVDSAFRKTARRVENGSFRGETISCCRFIVISVLCLYSFSFCINIKHGVRDF